MTEFVRGHVYWPCSVNSRACANGVYQALLSPPLEPGNEASHDHAILHTLAGSPLTFMLSVTLQEQELNISIPFSLLVFNSHRNRVMQIVFGGQVRDAVRIRK